MNKFPYSVSIAMLLVFLMFQTSFGREFPIGRGGGNAHSGKHVFSFALIGDVPYDDRQVMELDNVIREVNRDRDVKFVMHAGDIKGGGARCDDQVYFDRFEQYQKFKGAFIYTPGDNEWTDCHRESNGQFNPLERLSFLRTVFFPDPYRSTGQRPISVHPQSLVPGFEEYVENVIFKKKRVVFSTIHIVGSNNNLAPWSGIDPHDSVENPRSDRLLEFQSRDEASIQWLNHTFDVAKRSASPGVLIMIHGNPRFDLEETEVGRAGFNRFINTLRERALEFQKPVVLVHGDFHVFFIDKPMFGAPLDGFRVTADGRPAMLGNVTRSQTFGSPDVHWLKVTVKPHSQNVFTIQERIVRQNAAFP